MEESPATPLLLGADIAAFLRRQFARAGVDGSEAPIVVNPRTQGWIFGFAHAVADGLALNDADRYSMVARVFVDVMHSKPSGERLGLEALSMAMRIDTFHGARDMQEQFHSFEGEGRNAAAHYLALLRDLDGLAQTLLVSTTRPQPRST
jgi:hypothetical protein